MTVRRTILLLATTTGYQTRVFADAAEKLGLHVVLATDRCKGLGDPWGDRSIPVRFHDPFAYLDTLEAAPRQRPFASIVAVGDRPTFLAALAAEPLEALVSEGRLQVPALPDKPDPLDGPFLEETICVTLSRQSAAAQNELIETIWRGLEALILRHALGEDLSWARQMDPASGVMMIPIPRAGVCENVQGLELARDVPGLFEVLVTATLPVTTSTTTSPGERSPAEKPPPPQRSTTPSGGAGIPAPPECPGSDDTRS